MGIRCAIAPGTRADYAALARHHYRAGPPATFDRILRATHEGRTVGVLVVSRPVLNARWRDGLWPGRFDGPDPRRRAERLNRELRCISRVIVDPRYRSLGLAAALVRAYLRAPLTPRTEAVAQMGAFSGFFRAAGMRSTPVPPSRRDAALLHVLRAARVQPWRLLDARFMRTLAPARKAAIDHSLRRCANDARGTRALTRAPLARLAAAAAAHVASPIPAAAFAFDSPTA